MWTRINRHRLIAAVALLLAFAAARSVRAAEDTLPPQLSDEAFWHLITDYSEAGGFFRFDNFISNEALFQHVLGRLKETTKPGGVCRYPPPEHAGTPDVQGVDRTFRRSRRLSVETVCKAAAGKYRPGIHAGRVIQGVGPDQNFTYIVARLSAMF